MHLPTNKAFGLHSIDVKLILASSNTPILNYEFLKCTQMVNHTSILASLNTLTNEALGGHLIGQYM